MGEEYLFIPGPVPVPDRVLKAMSTPIFNHRGPRFFEVFEEVMSKAKDVFLTKGDVFMLTSSGTGGMEAAVVNAISPGDRVLALVNGGFGERFEQIARAYGADVITLQDTWGEQFEVDKVREELEKDKDRSIRAILVVHSESSTGVLNDIKAISEARNGHPALLIVDAISSLGGAPVKMDEWGLDIVVSGSQKALMTPPGVALIAVNQRAWEAVESHSMPHFYFNLKAYRRFSEIKQTPFTPAISQFLGLRESLRMIFEEGLANRWERHQLLKTATRSGVQAMGLRPFVSTEEATPTLTSVQMPEGFAVSRLREVLRTKYNVVIGGGQKHLADKTFRIGHMGFIQPTDLLALFGALEGAFNDIGFSVTPGSGVAAVEDAICSSS